MQMTSIPFGTTDWSAIPEVVHNGAQGTATWRTQTFGDIRVRMVEYSAGYVADHWCDRGHILLVLEGSMTTELDDGRNTTLGAGSSYQVGDDTQSHRSSTKTGARLFIVD